MLRNVILAATALALSSSIAAADPAYVHQLVTSAAVAAGVPAHLAHAVVRQESNYNPRLRGRAGEWGVGQIKCQTARGVGFAGSCGALADPAINLRFSMRYLRLALDRGGAGCAGVSLYQRGVFGRASCSSYGRQVMARAGRI
jgi:soluble lytic murein transglycosylase-like protein